MAEQLRTYWIKEMTEKRANPKAKHIRKVENLERDLIETIKYGCKVLPNLKRLKT